MCLNDNGQNEEPNQEEDTYWGQYCQIRWGDRISKN